LLTFWTTRRVWRLLRKMKLLPKALLKCLPFDHLKVKALKIKTFHTSYVKKKVQNEPVFFVSAFFLVSPWIRFSNRVVKRELVCDSNVGKSVCSEISDVAPIVDEVVVVIVVAVVEGLVVVVLGSTGIT